MKSIGRRDQTDSLLHELGSATFATRDSPAMKVDQHGKLPIRGRREKDIELTLFTLVFGGVFRSVVDALVSILLSSVSSD